MRARVRGPEELVIEKCKEALPGCDVRVVDRVGDAIDYAVEGGTEAAPVEQAVGRLIVQNGWDLLELVRDRATLEDVFGALTLESEKEALRA